jgi:hypothetical protein
MIARHLERDKDVTNLSQTCKLLGVHMSTSVWRERAEYHFDTIDDANPATVAKTYRDRQMMYKTFVHFSNHPLASREEQQHCLSVLKSLILGELLY